MGLIEYFTRHRTAANLLLVLMVAAGAMALPNMRAQFFPDIIVESVSVSVRWDGAGPEDLDRGVVQLLEPALLAVEGVTESSATSREGGTTIQLEFEPGRDVAAAADDVQTAIDGVTGLPDGIDDPEVQQGRWRDRVTDVIITGPIGVDQLARLSDDFVTRLFAAGVTRTTLRGVADPEVLVEIPTMNLLRHDLTMADVAQAIGAQAQADPAGDVSGANARVRTGTARRDAADIEAIVLRRQADGTALTVGDVARVTAGGVDRERAYFVGDDPAISLRVDRSAEGDAIALQRTVEDVADDLLRDAPEGTRIDLIRSRTEAITGRIDLLLDNALIGLALVVGLLFLFLNARTAFWVAAGIPVAMLTAIAFMWAAGITLNMISLFALIITLGIVVDDAIVVGEHADFRARRLGEPPMVAAGNAARRMFPAVVSATVTTVIAFFGLVAIGGNFGSLIVDIPFTVIAVLVASLVECFLILPHHMAGALQHVGRGHWYDSPSRVVNRGFEWLRTRAFRPLVRVALRARYPVVAACILLLMTQAAAVVRGDVQWRLFNAPEQGSVTGNFAMVDGATRADALTQMRELQRATLELGARYEAEHGVNPLVHVLAEIGGNSGRPLSSADDKEPEQLGAISIELIEADLRPYSSFDFVAELQALAVQMPLTEEISFRGWRSGPGGDALSVDFYGADSTTLKTAAEALRTAVLKFPEVSGVEDSLPYDKDEIILELTPQGEALGFDIDALGRIVRNRLNGIEAATFPAGPRTGTIRVELPKGEMRSDFLDTLRLTSPAGGDVALSDIVTATVRSGFGTVRRDNGVQVVTVSGDIAQDDAARAADIRRELTESILPDIARTYQVSFRQGGLAEEERDFLTDAFLGFAGALLGIYLVLAWIFSSWSRPAAIMAIIPFGLIGAIWGHAWWDVPLSMFSVVGLIGMTGIIINDSIVLISTVDEYAKDRALLPAIVDAVSDRLRPILLTTLTTVLGLAPLLYETSSDAQFLRPTVITLSYGLGFGIVLVLILVPAVLAIGHDMGRMTAALRRMLGLATQDRGRSAGFLALGLVMAVALWGGVTLGWMLVAGTLPPPLAGLPVDTVPGAFGLFAAGTAAILLAVWVAAALAGARRRAA
ncbi:efflux RND transporter permease subunit [Jannaschia rubra]|uniref:Acriflavine resistance protein B n=1 Tax=Jannaschia rubra TaxID=282197 RepID=A0A0M6XSC0_9RHOB|nr:efflux RND transporter permease subunit [Jannaschia rubra]CTQ33688.1 Acriflavine resistance protein B [Jannaschia rubra]SFG06625.1 Multidrug efflux pump subunit AcrB [Jannaschia rubra]